MKQLSLALFAALAFSACGSDSPAPVAPTPVIPACQSQNTATVSITNNTTGLTLDVLIDNITKGSIAAGQTGGPYTVTAGINHTILSRITNTGLTQCGSTTSFAQCSTQTLTCR